MNPYWAFNAHNWVGEESNSFEIEKMWKNTFEHIGKTHYSSSLINCELCK